MPSEMHWRVHTSRLLEEILGNPGTGILTRPIQIFGALLADVGTRAAQLDDPQLNALMLRLTIYSVADPASPDYDAAAVNRYIARAGQPDRPTRRNHRAEDPARRRK